MTVLQRSRTSAAEPRWTGPGSVLDRSRVLLLAGLAGALAALVSLLVLAVPVLVAWLAEERSTVGLWPAAGIAVDVWALAHRGTVEVGTVQVVLAPLLLTLVPLVACRYAVNQVLVDRPERGVAPVVRGPRAAWRALAGPELAWFVGGYLLAGLVLCSLAGLGQAPVSIASVVPGLLLVPVVAVGLALRREHRRQQHPVLDRGLQWLALRVPVLVRRGLRPAGEALLILGAASVLLVTVMLVVRADRISALSSALDAGPVGAAVLTTAQVLALPNLLVWATGWLAGAQVSVGTVAVDWAGSTQGDLPLVPVLAALPEPGPLPEQLWLVVLVPVLTGCWLGWRSARAAPRLASWWTKAQIAVSACLVVVVVVLVLSWLASGGMAPGRLALVGTAPLLTAGTLLAELLAGALLTVTALHLAHARL